MGVYIKGMEMPKNGGHIQLVVFSNGAVMGYDKNKVCAVEVKAPHGRCIDVDEFLKDVNCGIWNWGEVNGVSDAITALTKIMSNSNYVPTVLEAEVEV